MGSSALCDELRIKVIFLMVFLFSSEFGLPQLGAAALGINYGQVANNLPSPEQVLLLINSLKITKARIYDTNPKVLTAFANSGIELIVTVPNEIVGQLTNSQQALQWLMTNVKPYIPATKITGIAVGNEVYNTEDQALMSNLVPAMVALHEALVQLSLDSYIYISTANSLAVLQNSYPPSLGSFQPELVTLLSPFLQFLATTKSPFWINAYPYFAYKDDPNRIPLDYVLFSPNTTGMVDPYTKLHYDNMLYAQVDAVTFAIARMGYQGIEVRVSETGWPSKGDADEIGATMENARVYNKNLLLRQMENEGTPLKPNQRLEVYLFALFNEDMKPGPTSERNYGLFQPDGTMAYSVGLDTLASGASISLTSSSTKGNREEVGGIVKKGDEEGMNFALLLLEEFNLPLGLLPLANIIEVGFVRESGYMWVVQEKKVEHNFKMINKLVSYETAIHGYISNKSIKKLEGVKAKELLLWPPVSEITVDELPTGKIHFKSLVGITKTFPVEAFAAGQ
ncbi:hypothetical protein J5N97_004533 [Dioscorea zingiberensis]|uniref:glucan endo-1,3-beta-D-glucosidase n=1 Tax=Dioscorea zingiberensis TaxID=325984 RepID=A0A9D5HS74_9LILI|nr:hypothetical protein J5N97_004533 [Dioscorea zingiberensis]